MTDEELAAVAVAVSAYTYTQETEQPERVPAWRRAMREESIQSFDRLRMTKLGQDDNVTP